MGDSTVHQCLSKSSSANKPNTGIMRITNVTKFLFIAHAAHTDNAVCLRKASKQVSVLEVGYCFVLLFTKDACHFA